MMLKAKVFIPITQGQVAIVDYADYELVKRFKWCAHKANTKGYYAANVSKNSGDKTATTYLTMHSLLMSTPKGLVTDHIDGNGLNNCRDNLRVCTYAENARNRKRKCTAKSKYKGVDYFKRDSIWRASIFVNNKDMFLGRFETEEDAARAYNKVAIVHFGEFAKLNIIPEQKD